MKKYEFTSEVMKIGDVTLKQIRRLADGVVGGYIETEDNLDHQSNAWVFGNARVYGDARVSGDAQVSGSAQVYGGARVYGDVRVYGNAQVSGSAQVSGDAQVSGSAQVSGDAQVSGSAWVYGNAQVYENARVYENAQVYGYVRNVFVCDLTGVVEGYVKTLNNVGGVAWIASGHRWFTLEEAIRYFEEQPDCELTCALAQSWKAVADLKSLKYE